MATAAVGTKRSFGAMNDEGGARNIWSDTPPPAQDARSAALNARSLRQRIGTEEVYSYNSSNRSTPRTTPTPIPTIRDAPRSFDQNASIVLVGIRGTGKSTLAVIASVACRRRVVDVDTAFQDATKMSTSKYRKQFGSSNYNLRVEDLLRTLLRTHDKGAILVCNGSTLERSGQVLLQEFSRTHPVIHIVRDLHSIHDYLKVWDENKLRDLLAFSGPVFRRCSNYEFYNVSETQPGQSIAPVNQASVPQFLTLKRAERTFLKFLGLIISQGSSSDRSHDLIPSLEPGFPLSHVATEQRKYTVGVQIPLSVLLSEEADIEELEFGSDAFEIVIDEKDPATQLDSHYQGLTSTRSDDISKSLAKVRRSTVVPVIYHVMPVGRSHPLDHSWYLEHLRYGLRLVPEYATLDLSLDEESLLDILSIRGTTKIIGHLHAAIDWHDAFWLEQYEKAMTLGCDLVRFTRPANFMDDNAAIQSFRNRIYALPTTIPLICYNTGRSGRRSACFNSVLTPVIPEPLRDSPTFAQRVEANPETSWLTAKEATHALYASFTYDPMKLYIVGASAGYSLSPAMHQAAYKSMGMPHTFQTLQTTSLNSLQEIVQDPHFGGTAISLPFKTEVIALTHSLSRHARAIGAVNTLVPVRHLNEDGSIPEDLDLFHERNQAGPVKALYGDNSDWIGIRACIRRGLSPANAVRPTSCGLVIGSGGMARAAIYAMLQLGVRNIVIFNRTYENAEKIVAHFDRLVSSSSNSALPPSITHQGPRPTFRILKSREEPLPADLRPPTIILSCIPTHPVVDSPSPNFTLPEQWMNSPTGGVVVELAYRTLNTPLMRQVRAVAHKSWLCLDGLDLLPEQGFGQFELFTGKRAPRRIMREAVLRSWTDEMGEGDPSMVERRLEAVGDREP